MNTNKINYSLEYIEQLKAEKEAEIAKSKERMAQLSRAIMAPPPTSNNVATTSSSTDTTVSATRAGTADLSTRIDVENINKNRALTKICELLNIDIKDTAAIGDSSNDIPMLEIAGQSFGIGMKNNKIFNNLKHPNKVYLKGTLRSPVATAINDYLLVNK